MKKLRQQFFKRGREYLLSMRSSLWFIPGLMIGFSLVLGFVLCEFDAHLGPVWDRTLPYLSGMGSDGSRGMLTAIAGSMLTVAGLCFSLTLSTISQASAQYTPRILRNFMRDRRNQFILGYFVSTFTYCLVVLRTIRGGDEFKFVPTLAVLAGLVFAIGGVLVLIYFIHHVATSLEITNIIQNIEAETAQVTESLFPDKLNATVNTDATPQTQEVSMAIANSITHWYPINSTTSGYIQFINFAVLTDYAVNHNVVLRMEHGVGHFVGVGGILLQSSNVAVERDWDELKDAFSINHYRTIDKDVGFGIRQIVDIALKALSPGINDTSTAISCIDYLGAIVGRLAPLQLTPPFLAVDGEVRVLVKAPSFEDYMGTAFDQIRISGTGNIAILVRLLKAFTLVGERSVTGERTDTVRKHMELTRSFATETLITAYEKEQFQEFYERALKRMTLAAHSA